MNEAVEWLLGVCGDLTALEPALETIFAMAGLSTTQTAEIPSLRDLASGYIRDQHQRGGDAPNDLGARLALERDDSRLMHSRHGRDSCCIRRV